MPILSHLEAALHGPAPSVLRLGVALPMSGVLGQVGPSALEAVLLAAEEVRVARSSRSERPIELVLVDSGARRDLFVGQVADLAQGALVEAFVGLHTSDALLWVQQAIGLQHLPYVFTAGHEGLQRPEAFACTGESCAQLVSGLGRVMESRDVRRWAILGTDYIWPRVMRREAREVIASHRGEVVLDTIMTSGQVHQQLPDVVAQLRLLGVGGVVLNLPGRDLTATMSAIRDAGLDRRTVRFSGGLEENALYAVEGDRSGNLYAAMHSYSTLRTPRRAELNARYRAASGDHAPVLNSWAEHCYDAVHMLARLDAAGRLAQWVSPTGVGAPSGGVMDEDLFAPAYEMHLTVAEGMAFTDV